METIRSVARIHEAYMKTLAGGAPPLRLLIAGVAAILLGTSAIATVMAWTPAAPEVAGDEQAASAAADAPVRAKCAECGVVGSMREIDASGKSGMRYEVTVRMKDGSSRVFIDSRPENWRPGERVMVIAGASRTDE